MISFTAKSKEKIHEYLKAQDQAGMALRIAVTRTDKGFSYRFELEDYTHEKTDDVTVREGGFATRLSPESAKWIRGATIDWVEKEGKVGFDVQNPNQATEAAVPGDMNAVIVEALKTIFDPEIPVNIYDLGLIYNIDVDTKTKTARIRMTLTAPNCPAAEQIPAEVEQKVKSVPGIDNATIELTWEPPWTKEMMSDVAKLQLNLP